MPTHPCHSPSLCLQIELSPERILSISAERRSEVKTPAAGSTAPFRTERTFGRFVRRLRLPEGVVTQGINARLDNGVLTLTLPMAEAPKPQTISIPVNGPAAAAEEGSGTPGTAPAGEGGSDTVEVQWGEDSEPPSED
jgi:hypothetical protein